MESVQRGGEGHGEERSDTEGEATAGEATGQRARPGGDGARVATVGDRSVGTRLDGLDEAGELAGRGRSVGIDEGDEIGVAQCAGPEGFEEHPALAEPRVVGPSDSGILFGRSGEHTSEIPS